VNNQGKWDDINASQQELGWKYAFGHLHGIERKLVLGWLS